MAFSFGGGGCWATFDTGTLCGTPSHRIRTLELEWACVSNPNDTPALLRSSASKSHCPVGAVRVVGLSPPIRRETDRPEPLPAPTYEFSSPARAHGSIPSATETNVGLGNLSAARSKTNEGALPIPMRPANVVELRRSRRRSGGWLGCGNERTIGPIGFGAAERAHGLSPSAAETDGVRGVGGIGPPSFVGREEISVAVPATPSGASTYVRRHRNPAYFDFSEGAYSAPCAALRAFPLRNQISFSHPRFFTIIIMSGNI